MTINQRVEVKDFVDLYYLLRKFSLWDLNSGVKRKFNVELEPLILASDFLAMEQFDFLPKMIKPLTLKDLKEFYREKAKTLARKKVAR